VSRRPSSPSAFKFETLVFSETLSSLFLSPIFEPNIHETKQVT